MAADAAVVLHLVQPRLARDPLRDAPFAAEVRDARDVQHREPVDGRVVLRGRGIVGRDRRREVDDLSWRARHLRTIHQPVAARPDRVVRLRQIGEDVTSAVIGDDRLDVARRQITRLGDHPDAGFGPVGARHHAADVVVVDGDSGLLRARGSNQH